MKGSGGIARRASFVAQPTALVLPLAACSDGVAADLCRRRWTATRDRASTSRCPGADSTACLTRGYLDWRADYPHGVPTGTTTRLWVLDVAGERVLVDAHWRPGVPRDRVLELFAIARSARFST